MRQPSKPNLLITPSEVEVFDRQWSGDYAVRREVELRRQQDHHRPDQLWPGTGLPLHSHNCEESVLILEGEAVAQINDDIFDLEVGQATRGAAGVPHRFYNRGEGVMRIYWGRSRDVTRTIIATGETFEHLSPSDKGGLSTR